MWKQLLHPLENFWKFSGTRPDRTFQSIVILWQHEEHHVKKLFRNYHWSEMCSETNIIFYCNLDKFQRLKVLYLKRWVCSLQTVCNIISVLTITKGFYRILRAFWQNISFFVSSLAEKLFGVSLSFTWYQTVSACSSGSFFPCEILQLFFSPIADIVFFHLLLFLLTFSTFWVLSNKQAGQRNLQISTDTEFILLSKKLCSASNTEVRTNAQKKTK